MGGDPVETKQIEKAYVFRLYPTERQETLISKAIGCARFVYNYFLARCSKYYEETGTTLGYSKCNLELTLLKQSEGCLWLNEVDKFALQNSLRDLDTALHELGSMLKKSTRGADIVSRYGGGRVCSRAPGYHSGNHQEAGRRTAPGSERASGILPG
jgi:hypothetical protein